MKWKKEKILNAERILIVKVCNINDRLVNGGNRKDEVESQDSWKKKKQIAKVERCERRQHQKKKKKKKEEDNKELKGRRDTEADEPIVQCVSILYVVDKGIKGM